jgi:hypothetical protein
MFIYTWNFSVCHAPLEISGNFGILCTKLSDRLEIIGSSIQLQIKTVKMDLKMLKTDSNRFHINSNISGAFVSYNKIVFILVKRG